jgi:sulfite reductase (NADPH) flavoprotein alpha-component
MQWQAGDIAEIGPEHPPQHIESWLSAHGLSGASMVQAGDASISLRQHVARCVLPAVPSMLPATDAQQLSAQAWADRLLPLPHREYSIASIPSDGKLELLVRQMQQADGTLGLGSGWLSHYADCGSQIALRIRENRSFHAPPDDRPLILIGNGSGLAGLRAHLKQRAACGHHRNWLVFGERQRQHDYFYREEIMAWQASGVVQKLDLAFSRDQPQAPYVQDQLAAQTEAVRLWVADGAALYVCGSLQGMAAAVTATLTQILGAAQLEAMTEQGRYRRDVY